MGLTVPVLAFTRSSLYEHDGKTRHSTNSFGIGDIRFAAYRWMFDPKTSHKGNLQVGLGLKLPTGSYNYMDYFYKKLIQVFLVLLTSQYNPEMVALV
jgi:hypothetical protein